jgi:HEPN domain-containing protein
LGILQVGGNVESQFNYWLNECFETLDVAKVLYQKNKYLESAFFCNLACEKILKAAITRNTNQIPPKTHALVRLAKLSGIYDLMGDQQKRLLNRINAFQIEGRYPEDRKRLYETTPPQEFQFILDKTEELILWIHQKVK